MSPIEKIETPTCSDVSSPLETFSKTEPLQKTLFIVASVTNARSTARELYPRSYKPARDLRLALLPGFRPLYNGTTVPRR